MHFKPELFSFAVQKLYSVKKYFLSSSSYIFFYFCTTILKNMEMLKRLRILFLNGNVCFIKIHSKLSSVLLLCLLRIFMKHMLRQYNDKKLNCLGFGVLQASTKQVFRSSSAYHRWPGDSRKLISCYFLSSVILYITDVKTLASAGS